MLCNHHPLRIKHYRFIAMMIKIKPTQSTLLFIECTRSVKTQTQYYRGKVYVGCYHAVGMRYNLNSEQIEEVIFS